MGERVTPHILMVCSSGGHLTQLMSLEPWWSGLDRTWVTFDKVDAISLLEDEEVVWAHHPTTRNIPNLFRNLVLAFNTIRRLRPHMVVSSGAGVSFPFFIVAKLHRIPTCFIEVYDRIDRRTLSGVLCKPFTDVFMVQWEEQLRGFPDAHLIGRLL